MIRTLLSLTLLSSLPFTIAACSSIQRATPKESVMFLDSFKVDQYELNNGLRLLVVEDHSSPTFAYQTWFRVGSRDEVQGRTGLAHLFEHMMFKETKNMKEGEFDRLLEAAGVQGENAFTSRDYTAYIQELPKDKLELIAKAEADRMVNLVLNEKSFETERGVVKNERRFRTDNSPDGMMEEELFGLAFTRHPYHWPVIGYQADLDQMSADDARKFYRSFYSPNHATIIVAGDVNSAEVYKTVQKHYGSLKSQEAPAHPIPEEPPQPSPRHKQLKLNIQVEKLLMGYRVPAFHDKDFAALEALQSILSGGKSSRLYRALVDTGIASSADSGASDSKDPSLFQIEANLQNKKHAAQAEAVVLRELATLSKDLVSPAELERAKNKLSFGLFSGFGSNYQKCYYLGHYEAIARDFKEGMRHFRKIQAVTPEEVRNAVRTYLSPKNRTVITGVPK